MPRTAASLPSPGEDFWRVLTDGLAVLGLELTPGMRAAIDAQVRLLTAWNASINLTALRTDELIARGHVLDSLAAVTPLRSIAGDAPALIDLGSGAGFPGLPLALALAARRAALVDSIGKKASFLAVVAQAAMNALRAAREPATEIAALNERAEDLAAEPDHREAWDIVTARAVGSLAEVAELGLPLTRVGGYVVAWKRDAGDGAFRRELDAARQVIGLGGGARPEIVELAGADQLELRGHCLVVIAKLRPTAPQLPRPAAERRRTGTRGRR